MSEQRPVPQRVASRATESRLGEPLASSTGTTPLFDSVLGVIAAVGAIALLGLLNLLDLKVLTFRAILVAVAVGAPLWIILRLIEGTEYAYLFTGGIVKATRLRLQSVTWPEIEVLEVTMPAEGGIIKSGPLAYALKTRGRFGRIRVVTIQGDDNSELGDLLVRQVTAAGRPVRSRGIRQAGR